MSNICTVYTYIPGQVKLTVSWRHDRADHRQVSGADSGVWADQSEQMGYLGGGALKRRDRWWIIIIISLSLSYFWGIQLLCCQSSFCWNKNIGMHFEYIKCVATFCEETSFDSHNLILKFLSDRFQSKSLKSHTKRNWNPEGFTTTQPFPFTQQLFLDELLTALTWSGSASLHFQKPLKPFGDWASASHTFCPLPCTSLLVQSVPSDFTGHLIGFPGRKWMLTLQQSFRNELWCLNQISSFKNNRDSTCSILNAIIMMLPMACDCSVIFWLLKWNGITSVRGEVQFFICAVCFCIGMPCML